ncbi:MAG: hypothetical protein EPO30_08405 [Lysobacteraceae bacterium]|nr:MAG: hypothetical protein EPO30_08405 [Xanthomonadaceae bacterium]
MKNMTRMILVAILALPLLAACAKEEAPKVEAQAAMSAPAGDDLDAWRAYLQDVVPRNMGGIANQPYVYLLPGESAPDFQDQYDRMLEKAQSDVGRGIISGNMLAYASPASAKMADIVVASFASVPPGSMKGVRVLFIGQPADGDRVKAAVEPAGVNYVFVDSTK